MAIGWRELVLVGLVTATSLAPALAGDGPLRGVDVSHFSGTVDWHRVASQGFHFAYVKATEGVDNPDRLFDRHWEALEDAGLHRGAYHFYVTEDDPEAQARFFLETADPRPGDLRPAVDVETVGHGTKPGWNQRLRRFLEVVEAEIGVAPIVYTSADFWNDQVGERIGNYPLWVAEYGVDEPTVPAGWKSWWLWQWKGNAEIPGVEKDADLSRTRPGISIEHLLIPESRPSGTG